MAQHIAHQDDCGAFYLQNNHQGCNKIGKSFVERSMYKREMCKNWTEAGFCRYGSKCQYAHGAEELSDN